MLEDIVYTECYGGGIDLALILSYEDGAQEIGLGRRELLNAGGEVYVLPYGKAELSDAIGEVAM
jgi:hypothetical protein